MTYPFSLKKFNVFAVATTLCLGLSGCIADEMTEGDYQYIPVQASQNYPIKTVKGPQGFGLASHRSGLSANQKNALRTFAHKAQVAQAKTIIISRPTKGGPSERVAAETVRFLVSQHVDYKSLKFTGYAGAATGPVYVTYHAVQLATKTCGNWSKDLTETEDNAPYPNLGCAVQQNIAAQIAHPGSLENPLASDMAPAGQGVLAVNNAMKSVNTVTLPTNYDLPTIN